MSINFQQIAPIIAACMTTGGVIFQIGKHAEKLDIIGVKVEAQEKKEGFNNQNINEILGNVNILKNDIQNIKEDIRDIKGYMGKVK
jgi:tRNA1(Val) A37 N6-methylase TrmN6